MTGLSLRAMARATGGEVCGQQVLCPGPGHGPRDRSLAITLSATAPDGFVVYSHAGDPWEDCRDHVRRLLGIERQRPARGAQDRTQARAAHRRPPGDNPHRVLDIVTQLEPILGSPGEAYLRDERGIDMDAIRDILERTDAISWAPALYSTSRCTRCTADFLAASSGS